MAEGPAPSKLRSRQSLFLSPPSTISLPALKSLFLKDAVHFRARLEKAVEYLLELWVYVHKCLEMCVAALPVNQTSLCRRTK